MKYLKYILFLFMGLIGLFFIRGIFTPEITYQNEMTVSKPAEEAWAVMMDDANLSKWLEGYKRAELISGEANEIGAVSKIYVDEGGEEIVMLETITGVIPNEYMAMDFTMDFMNMAYSINFSEENEQTRVVTKTVAKGNSALARSIMAFIKGSMVAQEDANLAKLKELILSNSKSYESINPINQ